MPIENRYLNMDNFHLATADITSLQTPCLDAFKTSFGTQLTFIYLCLCLHNINFHQMMWTHIQSQVIDINLSKDFLLIYAERQQKKNLNDFTSELICWRLFFRGSSFIPLLMMVWLLKNTRPGSGCPARLKCHQNKLKIISSRPRAELVDWSWFQQKFCQTLSVQRHDM